jgi:hypothetical protein
MKIKGDVLAAVIWLSEFLPLAKPRIIQVFCVARPLVVFTDGACEDALVTCGAVLLDGLGDVEFLGIEVAGELSASWRQGASRQVIGQAELYPVLLALDTRAERMKGRHLLVFIDQDAARQALIKGYSPSRPSADIITKVFGRVATLGTYPWFSRVPTASNPADAASRLDFLAVLAAFPQARLRAAVE